MHTRIYTGASVAGIAALAAVGFAGSANAHASGVGVASHGMVAQHVSPAKKGNCYSNQMNDSGVGIVSQTFTDSGFDQYDAYGADNFQVQKTCNVTGVQTTGQYFNGAGPADSETVTFYSDNGGMPGSNLNSQTVVGTDKGGSFTIPLDTVALPPGKGWVSVSANMAFASGGEWGWELSTHQKQGSDAMWENPGGGLGTGCSTWGDVNTCLGFGNDFMVTLTK